MEEAFDFTEVDHAVRHVANHGLLAFKAHGKEAARLAVNEALDLVEVIHPNETTFRRNAEDASQELQSPGAL